MKKRALAIIVATLVVMLILCLFLIPDSPDRFGYSDGVDAYPFIGGHALKLNARVVTNGAPFPPPPSYRSFFSELQIEEVVAQIMNDNDYVIITHLGTASSNQQRYLIRHQDINADCADYYVLVDLGKVRIQRRYLNHYYFFDPSVFVYTAKDEELLGKVMFPISLLSKEDLQSCSMEENTEYPLIGLRADLFPAKESVMQLLHDFYSTSRWYRVETATEDMLTVSFSENNLDVHSIHYSEAYLEDVYRGRLTITILSTTSGYSVIMSPS